MYLEKIIYFVSISEAETAAPAIPVSSIMACTSSNNLVHVQSASDTYYLSSQTQEVIYFYFDHDTVRVEISIFTHVTIFPSACNLMFQNIPPPDGAKLPIGKEGKI